jgi:hypothetical protein
MQARPEHFHGEKIMNQLYKTELFLHILLYKNGRNSPAVRRTPAQQTAMGDFQSNQGSIGETFFLSQASVLFQVSNPEKGDFLLDDKYLFEVGGKDKTIRQITDIPDSRVVKDHVEYGSGRFLHLRAFGFLY